MAIISDGTVFYPFDQRVAFSALRREGFILKRVLLQVVFAENQVMGGAVSPLTSTPLSLAFANFYRFFLWRCGRRGIRRRSFRQFRISLHLYPLAFGADSPVTVRSGVSAVVNVTAVEQTFVLAVGPRSAFRSLGLIMASSISWAVCTPLPSSKKRRRTAPWLPYRKGCFAHPAPW